MRDIDLAYVAGILDGEGSINSVKHNGRIVVNVTITSTSWELMEFLDKTFPGYAKRNFLNSGVYHWHVRVSYQPIFLKQLLPYLVIKKEQAELALSYYADRPRYSGNWKVGIGQEEQDRREKIYTRLKVLNGRKTKPYVSKHRQRLSERDAEKRMR